MAKHLSIPFPNGMRPSATTPADPARPVFLTDAERLARLTHLIRQRHHPVKARLYQTIVALVKATGTALALVAT